MIFYKMGAQEKFLEKILYIEIKMIFKNFNEINLVQFVNNYITKNYDLQQKSYDKIRHKFSIT